MHTITRPANEHNWGGRLGRIDLNLLREVTEAERQALFYICGTPGMVSDSMQMLRTIDVPPEQIMQETFKGYARHMEAQR